MPVLDPLELPRRLPPGGRLLGLDLGAKRIGLAVSDAGLVVAAPAGMIARAKFTATADAIFRESDARGVAGLVIGLPVNMDGSEGRRCQATRDFAANLLGRRDLPLAFWDERLSTAAVERALIVEADMSRARRKQNVDTLAAAYILQGFLDRIRHHKQQAAR